MSLTTPSDAGIRVALRGNYLVPLDTGASVTVRVTIVSLIGPFVPTLRRYDFTAYCIPIPSWNAWLWLSVVLMYQYRPEQQRCSSEFWLYRLDNDPRLTSIILGLLKRQCHCMIQWHVYLHCRKVIIGFMLT